MSIFHRPLLALLTLVALLWPGVSARAALLSPASTAGPAQGNGITLTARPAYDGGFRPGTWMPVVVSLENAGVDRQVELRVGSREGAQYGARLDLPNGARKAVTVYTFLAPSSRRLVARLLSDGEELAAQTLTLQTIPATARFAALVAPGAPAMRPPARLDGGAPLVTTALAPADLPDQALGLSAFSSIVVEDVATADLSEAQREALREWVMRGGQLIIGGGTGLQRTLAGLPRELAPASAPGATRSVPPETLLGPQVAGLPPIPLAELVAAATPDRPPYALPLSSLSSAGVAVEQTLGRGLITVLAFPLAHPAVAGWEQGALLWGELLRTSADIPAGFAPDHTNVDGFLEGNLAASLTSLPALQFPPLGLLAGLVLLYIVLVGPVTYLVLRRLDRQMLGWVVVPLLTVVFGALTYGIGYAQRGGDVLVNQITLVEPVDGAAAARVRSFVGVFSPERRAYTLEAAAADGDPPLLRPISVQGPWDTNPGAAGGLFLHDVGPGALADDFQVAQWSMRALTSDDLVPGELVRASIHIDGERLTGEVTNLADAPLRDVIMLQGANILRLGDLAPGETRAGELQRSARQQDQQFGAVPVSYLIYGDELDRQNQLGGQPLSPDLQQRVRLLDAMYSYGPSNRSGQPLLLAWTDARPLALAPFDTRADYQHSGLVAAAPRVVVASDSVPLGPSWLAPRFEGNVVAACFGTLGAGLTLGEAPSVVGLSLPRDLYGLRPTDLALLTSADGPWPDDLVVELYDWSERGWVAQSVAQRSQQVDRPERFLSDHGLLRVRLSSPRPGAMNSCVYVNAQLTGALP